MYNISNINFTYNNQNDILWIVWFCARERVQNRHHNAGCKEVCRSLKFCKQYVSTCKEETGTWLKQS